jgi:xanthine dehydrogenase iron-sulfur cluster and FAD-binding subunit A
MTDPAQTIREYLARVREEHVACNTGCYEGHCGYCLDFYPCDAIRLADALEVVLNAAVARPVALVSLTHAVAEAAQKLKGKS